MNAPGRPALLISGPRKPEIGRWRRMTRQIGLLRLVGTALFLAVALWFARDGWNILLAQDAERALYDVRALLAMPYVDQDERIVMVVYTDETLAATGKRSPLDRKLLGAALRRIDAMGARAIGIDILIDQPQPEDPLLVADFRTMRTPTFLGFASNATNGNFMQSWQEDFLTGFLKRLAPGDVRPASIRVQSDTDDVMRNWPTQPASLPPLLANALAPAVHAEFRGYTGSIGYRLPRDLERPVFLSLPIDLFGTDEGAAAMAGFVRGRYVLIGGDISDVDRFDTPATRITHKQTTGLEVHASLLAQMLDGRMFRAIPGPALWLAAILVVLAGAATAIADMPVWRLALVMAAQAALIFGLPFLLQHWQIDTRNLPMFGWLVGWVLAYASVGTAARAVGSQQRRFAQSALGKYLPADVANQIMRDPDSLSLNGEKREIFALFSDLEGFTKLSHAIEPEMVAYLLNSYLDMLSDIVLEHGGTIDKFVGDAVVAFWGAPISRPDDPDRAARAAVAMYEAGERFREQAPPGVPPLGVTRVGLHCGDAIVGNFGGEDRIQYTALGDSMNTAARLEGANKYLKTTVLVSETAAARATEGRFRPMGRIVVSGRSTPLALYEPVPRLDGAELDMLVALYRRFDEGDWLALTDMEEYAAGHPGDRAIANLIYRLQQVGPGGSYVLESK